MHILLAFLLGFSGFFVLFLAVVISGVLHESRDWLGRSSPTWSMVLTLINCWRCVRVVMVVARSMSGLLATAVGKATAATATATQTVFTRYQSAVLLRMVTSRGTRRRARRLLPARTAAGLEQRDRSWVMLWLFLTHRGTQHPGQGI